MKWLKDTLKSIGKRTQKRGTTNAEEKETSKEQLHSNEDEEREIHTIKDTPFNAVRTNKDWYLVMGRYRLSKSLSSLEEVLAEAEDSWELRMRVMGVVIENYHTKMEEETEIRKEVEKNVELKKMMAE